MTTSFRLVGLEPGLFEPLFSLSDEALAAHGVVRRFATESPGYPCRIGLQDAEIGDELLLLPYVHQPAASPYRASGPIFVRRGAQPRRLAPGEIPRYVSSRPMSVRAYDAAHMMVAAAVCEGPHTAREIETFFGDARVAYIHLHNARQGCFSCRVERV